jgi:FkbM family methyltransferase
MRQLITYWRYFIEYLKFGDFRSIYSSIQYVLFKTSYKKDRIIQTSSGIFFCRNNTNDFQFANFAYEWGVKKFILKRKDEFSVFIDAGSCIGDYCILLSNMNKRCIAIEPVNDNIQALVKNLRLNNLLNKVTIFPYGLGDSSYHTSYSFNPVNTGASRIERNTTTDQNRAQITKLDWLMLEMGIGQDESIFIKLDVEGMEVEAIRGAAIFLKYYPKITLIIEDVHSGQEAIKKALNEIAIFEFGKVDYLNMYAKKIGNYKNQDDDSN